MQGTPRRLRRPLLLAAIVVSIIQLGCDSDQRVVDISRESLNRQAEQNAQMARQSQAVTETTHELIKAESTVQSDANQLQQELHAERSTLDQQRLDLENERRSLALERQRDPIIAESINGLALVVAAALPLVVCWYLVRSLLLSASEDSTAAEILLEELATQGPLLMACAQAALPLTADEDQSNSDLPPTPNPPTALPSPANSSH
jgi:MarR-like DNA-binding transcriptional regulator SgrR of sgrS sRNA